LATAAQDLLLEGKFSGKVRASLNEFFKNLDVWRRQLDSLNHVELAQMILEESGYTAMWKQDKSPDAPGRLENLKELIQAMKGFEFLPLFLEHISLVMDTTQENQDQMISIMTLHSAKGLEFDTVFLCGWEEGLFPHPRAIDESGEDGLEEERRLAYVGLTRGRQRAIITFALRRRTYQGWQQSTPSRFIRELPDEHVELKNMNTGAPLFGNPSYGRVIDVDFDDDFN
jgi:DNA helicase II / ATP-dependent DNA helicase PcrA